ncbi:protein NPAT [Stegastes partitus]|uniref:Nuclear protein, ataxia-telangiectasia locus n=1 Tax=Stegastes partitus TaxID=144197 RepID=A0A3B5B9Y6_9TELE|nr:PREDICTED: protein NPAT [Stegastes partitus]
MLLPSDVARLVLGYLQEEGLSTTSQAFIHESPNLKEYAEHTIGDGTIPACVFSVFGKGLTTILNEYMAAVTKESSREVPAMMTSLWKKLDFTLNQIKSLQNSPAISANQRLRSRVGVANMARQRTLTVTSADGVICSSVSETSAIVSPAHTSHSMLGHSTPGCYTAPHNRPASGSGTPQQIHDGSRLVNTPRDSPVQIIVSENRLNPGPMSPGRRKWDNPRKRSGALSASSGSGRTAMTVTNINSEPQPEEVVDENFPQLVIQNARDKILGDRSLQEKLAENINKILANEPVPQTSKASSSTVEADQSIDEILGLQGEIHMSDDAIHDILEQTESDPAFQALFDLFDYHKNKFTDGETEDGDFSSSPEENDTAGPSSAVRPLQGDDPDAGNRDANALDTAPVTLKMRAGQERKTRKSTAPTLLKKTIIGPSGRASRIENSSARLLVSRVDPQSVSSTAVNSSRKEKAALSSNSADVTPMDIDAPLSTPPLPLDSLASQEPATTDSTSITPALSELPTVLSSRDSVAFAVPEDTLASNMDKKQEHKRTQGSKEKPAAAPSTAVPVFLSPVQNQLNNTTNLPHTSVSNSEGETLLVSTVSVAPESDSATSAAAVTAVTTASLSSSASTSATFTTTSASPASSSCTPDPSTTYPSTPTKAAADSSNIMSLKIIISDNQEEDSSSEAALNQAIASISRPKIPTIYLSSPAKSPAVLGTPKANLDEAALAVSGLQRSEAHASPLSSKAGAVVSSPLAGASQAQQSYIIQLPLDTTNPAVPGATTNYFLVTEPQTTDVQTRQMLLPVGVSKGQSLPTNQYGVTTPTLSSGFSTGSALILPSPVKPMMLPISVVGQNTLGKVQMVSNQLIATPNRGPVNTTETSKANSPSVATKQSATAGTEKNLVGIVVQPVVADNTGQQDAAKGPSHRRILCFDSSQEVQPQTAKTTPTFVAPNASTSQSVQQAVKDKTLPVTRTKPTILGGNKPKRRIEPIRCTAEPKTGLSLVKESNPLQQQEKDSVKKNSRKQEHAIHSKKTRSASTNRVDVSQPEAESRRRSKSIDRKHNCDTRNDEPKAKDSHTSRSSSSDSAQKSGIRKDKEESGRKEPAEKVPLKSREGRTEKRTPSQEIPNVTANKENEIKGSTKEQSTPLSATSRDFSPPAVPQVASNIQSKAAKAPSKTISLAKQAAEMLQDMQGHNSPSTPVKKVGPGSTDVSLPGTGHNQEPPADCPRTPSRQKKGKDGEGTPKHLLLPNTPDVPSCSPASETGSENSINMAAHTLMILSRAAIARTGTPLKDSLRQEGVEEKSPTSSKNSKKRKQSSPTASPPAKKESKRSPSKKKDRERKKLIDCFPHDLDVDKFLSSLHYDE